MKINIMFYLLWCHWFTTIYRWTLQWGNKDICIEFYSSPMLFSIEIDCITNVEFEISLLFLSLNISAYDKVIATPVET